MRGCRRHLELPVQAPFVVVTRTCDIVDPRMGPKRPLIMAAPLISSAQVGELASVASQGRVGYLILSEYSEPKDPSLNWLVRRPSNTGSRLERGPRCQRPNHEVFGADGLMRLAESVAHKFARPAVVVYHVVSIVLGSAPSSPDTVSGRVGADPVRFQAGRERPVK